MFIDLNNSTSIAEKLQGLTYHNFINDFFNDITQSIVYTQGKIYQYVGDEVVVYWNMKTGIKNANCIYTYFYALQCLEDLSEKYLEKYRIIPSFKASIHCGHIIRGEVGDIKSEIVFHGDVMNSTSRMERLCSELNEPLLISKDLYQLLPLFVQAQLISKGNFKLRGKEQEIETHGLLDTSKNCLEPES